MDCPGQRCRSPSETRKADFLGARIFTTQSIDWASSTTERTIVSAWFRTIAARIGFSWQASGSFASLQLTFGAGPTAWWLKSGTCCAGDNPSELSKVAVIGAGYVGLTTAACLADLGNDVVVVDVDREKIALLLKHQVPFYEPGLTELGRRNAESRRLPFATSHADAEPGAD